MIETKYTMKTTEKAVKNFENIKKSIKGLFEILNICLPDDDVYFEAGSDNLTALYKNLLELLTNNYGLRQVVKKIENSEIDLNIVLNENIAQA